MCLDRRLRRLRVQAQMLGNMFYNGDESPRVSTTWK